MCQKYSVTVIVYSIFHIKPQFFKTLFQSQFLFDFDNIFTNRSEKVCSVSIIFLQMYYQCIVFFDIRNLVLCLTCELVKFIDYKIMLKLQCKTTFNSAFVGRKKSSKSKKSRL